MSRNPVITEPPNLPCQVKSHKEKPLEKMKQSLKDKTIVVTGAATGIGLALSRLLVSHGARLIGVGHSIARCEEASRLLLEAADNSRFVILPSELSLMSNVRDLSTKIRQHLNDCGTGKLDALVLNAAAVPFRQIRTIEGMDTQWTVNYLSGFLLSHLLIPELANAGNARLISVSSDSHYNMHMRWQNLQFDGFYHPLLAYKQSKLAQVMFTAEFNRRMKGATGITALVSDPGLVRTDIGFKGNSIWMDIFWKWRSRHGRTTESAAEDILFLLEDNDVLQSGHIYWKYRQPKMPNRIALDENQGRRLRDISTQLAGLAVKDSSL